VHPLQSFPELASVQYDFCMKILDYPSARRVPWRLKRVKFVFGWDAAWRSSRRFLARPRQLVRGDTPRPNYHLPRCPRRLVLGTFGTGSLLQCTAALTTVLGQLDPTMNRRPAPPVTYTQMTAWGSKPLLHMNIFTKQRL